jgi:hypothetical protein
VNYGDGIDWWKLRYTYTNTGAAATPVPFQINTWFVWKAGRGTEVMDTATQPPIAPGQSIAPSAGRRRVERAFSGSACF